LLGALVALRRLLRDLSAIAPFLADLGARHAGYGLSAEHYPLVGGALLETMVEVWQPEFTTAWTGACQTVALIMVDGVGRSAASRRQGPDLDHLGGLDPPPRFSMSRHAVHEERRVQAARRTRLGREAPRTRGRRVGAEIVSLGRRRQKVDRPLQLGLRARLCLGDGGTGPPQGRGADPSGSIRRDSMPWSTRWQRRTLAGP
jgi:hypothetical protein